jgi:DNA-binding MarR family transcriptional regulator
MKLEDELKQTKPFKSEIQKLVVNISLTSSWLNSVFAEKLKPFEISPPQYNVLRILKGKYPDHYSNQEITERMIDKSSNATRIVDKLVIKKLVSRTADKNDRRAVNIKITDKGLKLLAEIDKAPFKGIKGLMDFNAEKAKLMNEWLDEMRG